MKPVIFTIFFIMNTQHINAMMPDVEAPPDQRAATLDGIVKGFASIQTFVNYHAQKARSESTSNLFAARWLLTSLMHQITPPLITQENTTQILTNLSTLHKLLQDQARDQLRYHKLAITIDQLLAIIGQHVLLLEQSLGTPDAIKHAQAACTLKTQFFDLLRHLPQPARTGISTPVREGIAGLLHMIQHEQLSEVATSDPLSLKPLASAALTTGLAVLTRLHTQHAAQKSPEALAQTVRDETNEQPSALTCTLQQLIELVREGVKYLNSTPEPDESASEATAGAGSADQPTYIQQFMSWLRQYQDMKLEESRLAKSLQFFVLPDRGPTTLWFARNWVPSFFLSQVGVPDDLISDLKESKVPPSSIASLSDQVARQFHISEKLRASIRAAIPGTCARLNWLLSKECIDGIQATYESIDPALAIGDTVAGHAALAGADDTRFIDSLRSWGEQELALRNALEEQHG